MTYQIFQLPKQTLIGSAAIKPSWKVSFFLTGTTTPTPVYTTSTLSVAHTQPVQADSGGVLATVYLDPSIVYKASVYDQNDVLQYTVDPVNDAVLSQSAVALLLNPRTTSEASAAVTPTSYIYDTSDYGDMRRYGIPVDGTSDCTAALNKAIAIAAVATEGIKFTFPKIGAYYRFTTKPDTINSPIWLCGQGKIGTSFLRDYNGSVASDALLNFGSTGEGAIVEKMQILSASGRSGGSLISAVGDASAAPGWIQLKDLYLSTTGTDTHNYALYVDGSLKTGAPIGVRSMFLDNCSIFGGSLGSVHAKSLVAFNATNSQTFSAGGTSGKVKVTGTSGNESYYFYWHGSAVGSIEIDNALFPRFDVADVQGNVDIASTALDAIVTGTISGTLTDSGTRTTIITPTSMAVTGNVSGKTVSTTTKVGHVGVPFTTSCGNGQTFTFTPSSGKMFAIATAGGAAALVFADYKSATITILADPSNEFEASSTPAAGQTGIFKSSNDHAISIKNGVGSTVVYDLLHFGNVNSVTNPA